MILIETGHSGTVTTFLQGHMIWEGAEFESLWGFCEPCTVILLTKGILRQNEIFICSMNNNCWGSREELFTFQSSWILLCALPHWADQRTVRRRMRWYRRPLFTSDQTSEIRGRIKWVHSAPLPFSPWRTPSSEPEHLSPAHLKFDPHP